jgi:hypothetical protein
MQIVQKKMGKKENCYYQVAAQSAQTIGLHID